MKEALQPCEVESLRNGFFEALIAVRLFESRPMIVSRLRVFGNSDGEALA